MGERPVELYRWYRDPKRARVRMRLACSSIPSCFGFVHGPSSPMNLFRLCSVLLRCVTAASAQARHPALLVAVRTVVGQLAGPAIPMDRIRPHR